MSSHSVKISQISEWPNKTFSKMIPHNTLKQCCLGTIGDFLLCWSRNPCRYKLDIENANDNPFYSIPLGLRQDMLNSLLSIRPHGKELLFAAELLVSPGIESFDLGCIEDCTFPDFKVVMDILIRHGHSLRYLRIVGHWLHRKESITLLHKLLLASPNLRQLQLQHTTKAGKEVEIIAECCKKLQKLEILHPSLDELDVQVLANKINSSNACWPICEYLHEIRLPSSVNGRTVLLLLQIFPNLEYVQCAHLEQFIDEVDTASNQEFWKLRLSRLQGIQTTHSLNDDALSRLVWWCPNLRKVSLEVQEGMALYPLSQLSQLQCLQLRNSPTLSASYTEEVLSLLKMCGQRLLHISLEQFDVIDLVKTASFCPNLRSFSAQWFTILGTGKNRKNVEPFGALRYLRLRPQVNRKISTEACEMLLSYCHELRHLELYCCYGLNDALVKKVVYRNVFRHLRSVVLRHGHRLSADGINRLTKTCHKLRVCDTGVTSPKSSEQIV
ncbi:uncharacterized protein LOC143223990 [Tachypleus tridentatus]|uniref:uncharacterized protein LOC143223990 n=1 Tax=Tachypleus tridentatus TaxID=6853 RepID=UPI003FD25BC3